MGAAKRSHHSSNGLVSSFPGFAARRADHVVYTYIPLHISHLYSFVGALGRGPKYLVDEYAVMDTRYWPLDDPTVAWISYLELAVYVPLCYFWYRGVVSNTWSQHFHALIVSTFQLMGCILYLGCEWHNGFSHLPSPVSSLLTHHYCHHSHTTR